MAYKRRGRKSFSFMARTRTGWKQLGTATSNKALAARIEGMWETLAREHRAWDLLEPVLAHDLPIGLLFDLWCETRGDLGEAWS
jgi:hypothetical protein